MSSARRTAVAGVRLPCAGITVTVTSKWFDEDGVVSLGHCPPINAWPRRSKPRVSSCPAHAAAGLARNVEVTLPAPLPGRPDALDGRGQLGVRQARFCDFDGQQTGKTPGHVVTSRTFVNAYATRPAVS